MSLLFDKFVKGPVFGCQQCGQCLLSQTGYVCPMTCPKGLRNGPCGGTLGGACEVLPDRPCVWLRIRDRAETDAGVHRPLNEALVGTSSWASYVSGRDRETRLPQPYQTRSDAERPSVLARKFDRVRPVITYEIASPRDRSGLSRVSKIVRAVEPHIDAINTTTNAGGVPSLHSLETARTVVDNGVPPIVQFCGRDQGPEQFTHEVRAALEGGFANILALTGDWNPNDERTAGADKWFPMDSLQMVDILAGKSGFVKKPFIGVASTAYMTPVDASVARFIAKLRAGADFTQTQIVTESAVFGDWIARVRAEPEGRRCKILASVPLIGKPKPFEILRRLPGVVVEDTFAAALESADDMEAAGIHQAQKLIRQLMQLDIDGIHLMNFGVSLDRAINLIEEIRSYPLTSAA